MPAEYCFGSEEDLYTDTLQKLHECGMYPSIEASTIPKAKGPIQTVQLDKNSLLKFMVSTFEFEIVKFQDDRIALVQPSVLSDKNNPMNFFVKKIDLKDVTLDQAISSISKTYNLNLYNQDFLGDGPSVHKITIQQSSVTVRQIVDNMAMQAGYKNWSALLQKRKTDNAMAVLITWESR